MRTSIGRLLADRNQDRLAVDAFKLPHHGSRSNVSLDLLAAVDSARYLFSSNGAHTKHPHPEAVARVLVANGGRRRLLFNYTTRFNDVWGESELCERHDYDAGYPAAGAKGLLVEL